MKITKTLALIGALAAGSSAMATPITGTINFGNATSITLDTPGNFQTVTAIDFADNTISAFVTGGGTGDLGTLPIFTIASFKDISIGSSIPALWTAGLFTFDLTSSANVSLNNTIFGITGTGVLHHPLFDDTEGVFSLSSSRSSENQLVFSFQSTTSAGVPDGGATAMLLGAGLIGLCAVRRKVS